MPAPASSVGCRGLPVPVPVPVPDPDTGGTVERARLPPAPAPAVDLPGPAPVPAPRAGLLVGAGLPLHDRAEGNVAPVPAPVVAVHDERGAVERRLVGAPDPDPLPDGRVTGQTRRQRQLGGADVDDDDRVEPVRDDGDGAARRRVGRGRARLLDRAAPARALDPDPHVGVPHVVLRGGRRRLLRDGGRERLVDLGHGAVGARAEDANRDDRVRHLILDGRRGSLRRPRRDQAAVDVRLEHHARSRGGGCVVHLRHVSVVSRAVDPHRQVDVSDLVLRG